MPSPIFDLAGTGTYINSEKAETWAATIVSDSYGGAMSSTDSGTTNPFFGTGFGSDYLSGFSPMMTS